MSEGAMREGAMREGAMREGAMREGALGAAAAAGGAARIAVRPAEPQDVERVLDLLTHYDEPRKFFEPWYHADPAYEPQHSWLVEEDGQLVAALRIYPRWLRLGSSGALQVAGIGNVVTARQARGRGHADRLLRASLAAAVAAGYPYSLLWTHLPGLYARHGYGPAPEETLQVSAEHSEGTGRPPAAEVRPAERADLDAVAALQARFDQDRCGPAVRALPWWWASRSWLGDDLLVAVRNGAVVGYVSRRLEADRVVVLELGVPPDDPQLGRQLLGAAARPRRGRLQAKLPPSLHPVVQPWHPSVAETPGLMGRPLSLSALAAHLSRVWPARLVSAGTTREVVVPVAGPAGVAGLRVTPDRVDVTTAGLDRPSASAPALTPGQLTALILRGCDEHALELLGDRADLDQLAAVAPPQDFVLWATDGF